MAHEKDDERFGEKRPARKDEWGNDYRTIVPVPMKCEMKCDPKECKDHVTMTFLVEADVPAIDGVEALRAIFQGQEIPMKKQFVVATKVLLGYN